MILFLQLRLMAFDHSAWLVNKLIYLVNCFRTLWSTAAFLPKIENFIWLKNAVSSFINFVIPLCNRQTTLVSVFNHLISTHLESLIITRSPLGLNAVASDESMEPSHSFVRKLSELSLDVIERVSHILVL